MTKFNYDKVCKGLFKLLNDPRLTGSEKETLAAALELFAKTITPPVGLSSL